MADGLRTVSRNLILPANQRLTFSKSNFSALGQLPFKQRQKCTVVGKDQLRHFSRVVNICMSYKYRFENLNVVLDTQE